MASEKFTGEVYRLIGQIAERTERISGYSGRVPLIEIDLAMDEIRKLYDCFLLLRGADLQGSDGAFGSVYDVPETPPEEDDFHVDTADGDSVVTSASAAVIQEEKPVIMEEEPVVKADPVAKEEPVIMEEPVIKPDPVVKEESVAKEAPVVKADSGLLDEPVVKAVSADPIPEVVTGDAEGNRAVFTDDSGKRGKEPVPDPVVTVKKSDGTGASRTILAEKLRSRDKQSIHELLAGKRSDRSISTRIQHHPISNLKSAIGLNEKFIFVYELFGGNAQEYSAAIDRLNSMPGREEAIGMMENMREQYHWDIENMAFQKLVDMVARRYS